jgi:hypothetical protein
MVSRLLLQMAIAVLVFVSLIDPSDMMLHLKAPFFASVMLVWLYRQIRMGHRIDQERSQKLSRAVWITVLIITVVIPSGWSLIGFLNFDLHSGDAPFGLLRSFLFFSIALVLVSERIGLASLLIKWSVLIALLTLVMVAINLFSNQLFFGLYAFIMDKQNGVITPERDPIGLGIGEFYYASCPIMIFSFAYYCERMLQYATHRVRSIAMSLLFGAALLLTGARADILAMAAVAAFLMLIRIRKGAGLAATFLVGATIIAVGAGMVLPRFADKQEGSNAIKLGHFYSYIEEFDSRSAVLLVGEGANSAFYSQGFEKWTVVTELTYLELIRIFGLPMVGLFGVGLSWIAYRLFANGFTALGLAYVGYLGVAASNPLLLNSTGFLVIAAMYEQAVKDTGPPLRLSNNSQAVQSIPPNTCYLLD